MNIRKIALSILLILIIGVFGAVIIFVPSTKDVTVNNTMTNDRFNVNKEETLNIVTTNFATFDFIRAIVGENANVTFLMGPGKDSHSYEPTAQDIIDIQKADVFVYVGGEMEKWADKVLGSIDLDETSCFCVADYVDFIEEKHVDGASDSHEHEESDDNEEHNEDNAHAFDEHIWSSPNNAIKMVTALSDILMDMDVENAKDYSKNAENYINEIKLVQSEIKVIVDNRVRDRLVFGDKMPMQYFLDEFGLTASAAFTGCSTETEPSAATIAYLVDKVKEEDIPVVLYIELNTGKVASLIANEVNLETGRNVESMQIQTLHNVSKDDFENGETYVSLMRRNLDVLKEALH